MCAEYHKGKPRPPTYSLFYFTRLNMLLLPWFLFIHFLTSIEKNGFSKSHLRIHWHFIYSSSSACKLFSKSSIFTLFSDHLLYVCVMLVPFVLVLYEHIFEVFSLSLSGKRCVFLKQLTSCCRFLDVKLVAKR